MTAHISRTKPSRGKTQLPASSPRAEKSCQVRRIIPTAFLGADRDASASSKQFPNLSVHARKLEDADYMSRIGGRMDDVRDAFAGVDDADAGGSDEIRRARHALRDAIRRKRGCDPHEARRIVGILDRATADILSK
jgi:hypothetical protein